MLINIHNMVAGRVVAKWETPLNINYSFPLDMKSSRASAHVSLSLSKVWKLCGRLSGGMRSEARKVKARHNDVRLLRGLYARINYLLNNLKKNILL